jgi:hypothetical protein
MGAEKHGDPEGLATQLLGTHRPQRTGIERFAGVHPQQSGSMDLGPVISGSVRAKNLSPHQSSAK